jgi:hypothetical protein
MPTPTVEEVRQAIAATRTILETAFETAIVGLKELEAKLPDDQAILITTDELKKLRRTLLVRLAEALRERGIDLYSHQGPRSRSGFNTTKLADLTLLANCEVRNWIKGCAGKRLDEHFENLARTCGLAEDPVFRALW